MPSDMQVVYSTEATSTGGRAGRVRTPDGRLDVPLAVPAELQGDGADGTNPEQLFAAGYAACFHSALQTVAGARRLDLDGSTLTARVRLGSRGPRGFGLAVELELRHDGLDAADAGALMAAAHELCPYSKAVRGNVPVELAANGRPVAIDGSVGHGHGHSHDDGCC
jgi:Ohr subfamily peroxiredoxin